MFYLLHAMLENEFKNIAGQRPKFSKEKQRLSIIEISFKKIFAPELFDEISVLDSQATIPSNM